MSYLNSSNGNFGYKYNAGANVVIALNDQAVMEAVGISYNVIDSAAPIYGYSSRLFDAVAPGQKLIQGSFVINYVEPNYVYAMAQQGMAKEEILKAEQIAGTLDQEQVGQIKGTAQEVADLRAKALKAAVNGDRETAIRAQETLRNHYYGDPVVENQGAMLVAYDSTLMGPNRIQIYFGGQERLDAKHLIEMHGVYIIGHGSAIQADENVILEEYNFIARELVQAAFSR